MRAFKFRIYDEKKNCWVTDYLQYYPTENFVLQGHTIQQFTGILDKNFIEIYEGDFVKAKNNIVYTCKYSNEEAAFILTYEDDFIYLSDFDSLEVVGNIFDNIPESFENSIKDIENGKTVDLDKALTEIPTDEIEPPAEVEAFFKQVDEWEEFVTKNLEIFEKHFCKGEELLEVYYSSETMHVHYVTQEGQHVGDTFKIQEFLNFMES